MGEATLRLADFVDENGEAKIDAKIEFDPVPKSENEDDMTPAQRYMLALMRSIEVVKDKPKEDDDGQGT